VVGSESELSFTLPAAIRAGVELQSEVGAELGAMHDEIDLSPHRIRIEDAPGVGTYVVGQARDSLQVPDVVCPGDRGGVARASEDARRWPLVRDSRAPTGYVSVLTVDSGKHLLGIGGGDEAGGRQIGTSLDRDPGRRSGVAR
jgi:hypothetical protein